MENIKKYVNYKELNEEEKKTNKISYRRLIDRISNNLILCNNIVNIDNNIFDNIVIGEIPEDYEIFQYFIIDIDEWTIKELQNIKCFDVIIAYSEILENYILLVDHFGTSWDYVMTDIEPTEKFEEADL